MLRRSATFPVQRSLLSADALFEEARKRYDIDGTSRCELIRPGLSDSYLIAGDSKQYVLRVYRAGWRSEPEILWELSLLTHLREQGAPVAAPVRTRSGNWFCIVSAPEGPRHVVLFEYARGKPTREADLTTDRARAFGRGVASLHAGMDSFRPQQPRFDLDLYHLLKQPLQAVAPRLAHRPDELAYLEKLSDRLRENVVELDSRGMTRGFCHGDLHAGNAHMSSGGGFTFFDFDCSGPGWRAYDIAVFRWALRRFGNSQQMDAWEAFLEGYRLTRNLPKVDESGVPSFVAIREIWLMGLHASIADDFGFGYMHDAYFDDSLRFLKDWDAQMLF
jgi:Ser/Thr protein kinase RdoA (MazF antagonist)